MSTTAAQLVAKVAVEGDSEAKSKLHSVGQASEEVASSMKGNLLSGMKGAASGFLDFGAKIGQSILGFKAFADSAISAGQALIGPAMDAETMGISFKNLLGSTKAATTEMHALNQFAASTPFESMDVDKAAASLIGMGISAKDTIPDLTAIGDALFAVGHGSAAELSSVADIFGKINVAGKITGGDLTQLQQHGIAATKLLADGFHKTVPEIQAMVSSGLLPADEAIKMLTTGIEKNPMYQGGMAKQANSLGGLMSTISDNTKLAISSFLGLKDGQVVAGSLFDTLKKGVNVLGGLVSSTIFQNFASSAGQSVSHVMDHVSGLIKYLQSFELGGIAYQWRQLAAAIDSLLHPAKSIGNELHTLAGPFSSISGEMRTVTPLLTTLRNGFSQLLVSGIKDISNIIKSITMEIKGLNTIGSGNSPLGKMISEFKSFAPEIQNIGKLIGGEFMRNLRDLGSLAQQVGRWFQTSVAPALQQALPGFLNLAHTILNTVIPAFFQIRGIVMDVVEHAFKTFGPIIERIVPPLIRMAGIFANDLANGIKVVTPYVLQAAKEIGKFADEIMTRVAPIITKWLDQTKQGLDFFKAHWSQIWGVVGPILKGVWDGIVGIVKTAWAIVSGVIKIGLDLMSGNWKGAWDDLKSMLSGVWDGIKGIISGGLEIIDGMFGGLPGKALQWGQDLIGSFIQGIRNMIGGVGQAASDVMSAVHDFIGVHSPTKKGPGTTLDQWGLNLVRQFTNDIRSKTPEARLAAEDMMRQIQTAISGATTQLNMAKLSGNVAGQLAARNHLFDLNAQMSQYQNVIKSSGYSYNAKDKSNPIGFGGQTTDQMVALAGVNKFTKDIASTTTSAHKDAQNLFSGLLKSLDGFAMKIAMAQLSGNTDLVNKLQSQQTTQQTQLSLFEMLAGKKGLNLDETNMKTPISSFNTPKRNTAAAPSSVQYQFLGSRNQTSTPMVVHVQPNNIYLDGRMVANQLMPHMVDIIRYNTGAHI